MSNLKYMLYHGSRTGGIKVLEPRASRVIDRERAVFATDELWVALLSAVPHTSVDFDYGHAGGVPYIGEMWPGAFGLLATSGYVYAVSRRGFRSDPRLGMGRHELVKWNSAKVVDAVEVPDIGKALTRTGVKMIKWNRLAKWWRDNDIPEDRARIRREYRKKYGKKWPEPK